MKPYVHQKITPFLWFDNQTEEAVDFYLSIFPDSKAGPVIRWPETSPFPLDSSKPGTIQQAIFCLSGTWFFAFDAGNMFKFNPSISFFVICNSISEVDTLYDQLAEGGMVMMALDKYPFSARYAFVQDRFGISWQIILEQKPQDQKIFPSLMFTEDQAGQAREAIDLYTSLFQNSRVGEISVYGPDHPTEKEDSVAYGEFFLENQRFSAMDSSLDHGFQFTEAISLYVNCKDQEEIDYFWDEFTKDGSELPCGWLKDRFGVSWQIVPQFLMDIMEEDEPEKAQKLMEALSQMKKLDLEKLKEAYS